MFGLTDKAMALVFGGLSALLLALCAVLYIEANGFFWIDGIKDKLENCQRDRNKLSAALKAISDEKNEQQIVTVEKLKVVEKIRQVAEKQAGRIEQAPLPGNCQTPHEIMGADL